ncbi:UBIQUINOL-CYTOCHROME C REDUCTASE COMPLEX SUBUNIT X [Salix koriyanagi]|uniref:Complex III subunit 9 n=1 Tax=Salix koriyanagi TaxID=2511006 RepID=A0A9Q0ZLU3_9ROSI|nr:UBIQUINOL-CYTOCHROME C REDUCTASE COMPLEX SUBUNIT X [Salix koriyanagi]
MRVKEAETTRGLKGSYKQLAAEGVRPSNPNADSCCLSVSRFSFFGDLEKGKGMDYTARRNGGGVFEGLYKLIMRRNSIYVTFVIAGAFAGERAVDYGVRKLWESNNVGKRYEDIPFLGQRPSE